MKIVVLGAAGFVGSSIIDKLTKLGCYDIIGVDDLSYGYMERLKSNLKKLDFHQETVEQFCMRKMDNVDAIINCAAIAPLPENQVSHFKSLSKNVATCGAISDFSIRNNISKIIHFSSSAVYEGALHDQLSPLEEKQSLQPKLMYPVSKYLSEEYFRSQYSLFDLDITCIRLFNLYGPKQDYFRKQPPLLGYLIKCLLLGEVPTLYASSSARRDYVFIDDLVQFIIILLNKESQKSFATPNFGSGEAYSVYELVGLLENISGKKLNYQVGETRDFWGKYNMLFDGAKPLPMDFVRREIDKMSLASTTALNEKYEFAPSTSIEDGLQACIKYAETIL